MKMNPCGLDMRGWKCRLLLSALVAVLLASMAMTAPAAEPEPLNVVMAVGPNHQAMAQFRDYLAEHYRVEITLIEAQSGGPIPGIEALGEADVFLSNLRRTQPTAEQLTAVKQYVAAGKPVVGLRRAHHGFQDWLEADREIFGVHYGGHGGGGRDAKLAIPDDQKANPLVAGLRPFMPGGGLYDHTELDPRATVLLQSTSGDKSWPQMWTLIRESGQRVFYTRYDPSDVVKDEAVREVVVRAIFWAAGKEAARYRK